MYKVYTHWTPDGMVYVGVTSQKLYNRWKPSAYKGKSLWFFIEKFGWENIEHKVIFEFDNKEEALNKEDELIQYYRELGICINKQRSGHITLDMTSYTKEYNETHSVHIKERKKRWNTDNADKIKMQTALYRITHKSERSEYNHKYYEEHKKEELEYGKKLRSTPEGKIYDRVKTFNRRNPDKITVTPLEAKQNYLKYGFIPDFIKNDDLVA